MPTDSYTQDGDSPIQRYVLNADVSVHEGKDSTLVVRVGGEAIVIRGHSVHLVRNLLFFATEPRSANELAGILGETSATVTKALMRLTSIGLLDVRTRANSLGVDDRSEAALRLLTRNAPTPTRGNSWDRSVAVFGDRDMGADLAASVLSSIDVQVHQFGEIDASNAAQQQHSIAVLISNDRSNEVLDRFDQWSCDTGTRYVAGWLENATAVVTHLVTPGTSACYECLRVRESAASGVGRDRVEWDILDLPSLISPPPAGLAAYSRLLAPLIALKVVHFFAGILRDQPAPTLLEFDCCTFELTCHPVLRVPGCARCSYY